MRFGPKARHIYPSLVLVQPRKTRPCLTERLLMGHTESNQTKKQIIVQNAKQHLAKLPMTLAFQC